MFFNSTNFKTIEAGINIAWLDQQLHTQNIANVETPGYKTKNLTFDEAFQKAIANSDDVPNEISVNVMTDMTSLRQDGNNVDIEKENLELYKAYAQYSMLIDKMTGQFDNYNTVLNANFK